MTKIKSPNNLTAEQQRIYKGLLQIGDLMGAFYLDALLILGQDCVLATKVNLIAHLAREIDGGFRDVFAPEKLKIAKQSSMAGDKNGHFASILVALGFDNEDITNEWMDVAGHFHELAHRHGAWLKPKDHTEIKKLWIRYEKILLILTGSSYAFRDRISHLSSIDTPTREILGALNNLLKDRQNEFQFFKDLSKRGWLRPLFEQGYFDLSNATVTYDPNGKRILEDWLPLRYLSNIASSVDRHEEILIVKILSIVKKEVIAEKLLLDDYSVSIMYQIVLALPNYVFDQEDIDFLNAFNTYWPASHKHHESILTSELIEKYLNNGEKEGLVKLIVFSLGFRIYVEKIEGLEELGIFSQVRVLPNIEEVQYYHLTSIDFKKVLEITGTDLLEKLVSNINELAVEKYYELDRIPSIEVSEQSAMYSQDWISRGVNFLSSAGEILPNTDRNRYIEHLLKQKHYVHLRIAFHLIRLNYSESGAIFWEWIKSHPLDGHLPIHELYLLIKEITPLLSDTEFEILINWIEDMRFDVALYNEVDIPKYKINRIRRYLNAFNLSTPDQQKHFKEVIEKYEKEDIWSIEHPEYDSYSSFSIGYDTPISLDDLSNKNVAEQIDYIAGYRQKDKFDTSSRGLSLLLNNCIIATPIKYLDELNHILSLPPMYLSQVISSFTSVLKNGDLANWKSFIKSVTARLFDKEFVKEGALDERKQALSDFAEFILQLSFKNVEIKFSEQEIEGLILTLITLLELDAYKSTEHIRSSDHRQYSINSMQGKAFDALINFSKVWGERYGASQPSKFHPLLKSYLDRNLKRTTEMEKDFSIGIGYNLSYLIWADPAWVKENVSVIFPSDNELHKSYTMGSVLSIYSGVAKNVILFLKENELNDYAVTMHDTDSGELSRLARFAAVELLWNNSPINEPNSLISLIIAKGNPAQYLKLINVCLELKYLPEKQVVEVWKALLSKCLTDSDIYTPVLQTVSNLSSLVTLNSEIVPLIEASMPFLENGPSAFRLVRSLTKIKESDPSQAGHLILKIWKQTGIRVHIFKELVELVENLYVSGYVDIADEMCIYVGDMGHIGLKQIYDQYRLTEIQKK